MIMKTILVCMSLRKKLVLLVYSDGKAACEQTGISVACWQHMSDGAVLGMNGGELVEYDSFTLSLLDFM